MRVVVCGKVGEPVALEQLISGTRAKYAAKRRIMKARSRFKLEWAAANPKQKRMENDDFPDRAALLFPLSKDAPVNIWYWRADRPKAARHRDGRWSVVFARGLAAGKEAASFSVGGKVNVALAVWQGVSAERGGLKAFSPEWIETTLAA